MMRTARFILCRILPALLVLIAGCTPLQRGFADADLVSPSRPSFSVSVDMPLLAAGKASPRVYTESGYVFPEVYAAVYGTTAEAPMVVTALGLVPDAVWTWDPLSYSAADGPLASRLDLGDKVFDASLHVVDAAEDPFTPLIRGAVKGGEEPDARWLSVRYASLLYFKQAKVILEYREPLPDSLADLQAGDSVPVWNPDAQALQERAKAVFRFRAPYEGSPVEDPPYLKMLDGRRLGLYLGSFSRDSLRWSRDK